MSRDPGSESKWAIAAAGLYTHIINGQWLVV